MFTEKDRAKAADRVLDIDAWEFYVVATDQINRELGEQRSVGLTRLHGLTEAVSFARLKAAIDEVVAS